MRISPRIDLRPPSQRFSSSIVPRIPDAAYPQALQTIGCQGLGVKATPGPEPVAPAFLVSANLCAKEAREDGHRPPSFLAKGTSLVKEHYGPPRERIPEAVEAVPGGLTGYGVRRWSGAAWAAAEPGASPRRSTTSPSDGRARGRIRTASPSRPRNAA